MMVTQSKSMAQMTILEKTTMLTTTAMLVEELFRLMLFSYVYIMFWLIVIYAERMYAFTLIFWNLWID